MYLRNIAAACSLVVIGLSIPFTSAMAIEGPDVQCTLNADKSALAVIASNSGAQAYTCAAFCRMNVAGQRAFERFECTFGLGANAGERMVCERDGGVAGFFTELAPTRSTCVPR